MPIVYGEDDVLITLIWESANFAKGGGTTTLGFSGSGSTPTALSDLATAVVLHWGEEMRPGVDSDYTLAAVRYESALYSGEVIANMPGTASAMGPPSSVALLTSYYAAGKGRRNRGRSYWPGAVNEGNVDERGTVNPAAITAWQARVDAFFEGVELQPGPTRQTIPQSVTDHTVTPPQIPWPVVINRVTQPIIGTQRRRVRP